MLKVHMAWLARSLREGSQLDFVAGRGARLVLYQPQLPRGQRTVIVHRSLLGEDVLTALENHVRVPNERRSCTSNDSSVAAATPSGHHLFVPFSNEGRRLPSQ